MLKFNDDGIFVKLECCLPKYHPSAVWVDCGRYRNDKLIGFYEVLSELKSFSKIYGCYEIKHVDILLKDNFDDDYILQNTKGLNFKGYVNYLINNYEEYSFFVQKFFIELIKPLFHQTNEKLENEIKELHNELDIIHNELDLLRAKSKKRNKSKRRLISRKKRFAVLIRDNHRCQYCGASVEDGAKLHVDHILPVSKGGTNEMSNLQLLCEKCNLSKHNKDNIPHDKKKLKELREM